MVLFVLLFLCIVGNYILKSRIFWKYHSDIVCRLWRILWYYISSALRIWFYLGLYVELRPVSCAYIMIPVSIGTKYGQIYLFIYFASLYSILLLTIKMVGSKESDFPPLIVDHLRKL